MPDLKKIRSVYFLGAGGIGMSALARYFIHTGARVSGYDRTPTVLTDQLQKEGMQIHFTDDIAQADTEAELVIYTPAIPASHGELQYFKANHAAVMKRSEALALIANNKTTVAVAGSHGKTSVSCMLAHIFKTAGLPFTAFLGGIAANYNSNFIYNGNEIILVEADEFDRSFHRLNPNLAIITSVDTDHLDIYGTKENIEEAFRVFSEKIKPGGTLVYHESIACAGKLSATVKCSYGNATTNDFVIENAEYTENKYAFNISHKGKSYRFSLSIGGVHNVWNACAAAAAALEMGVELQKIYEALASYSGVKRRFEKVDVGGNVVYIDDYAHHPRELDALIRSIREMYPGKKLLLLFQPHLFSRTRDLATEFAQSLDAADEVVLLPVYPARELPIEGVTSDSIAKHMQLRKVKLAEKAVALEIVASKQYDVLVTAGAGDIDTMVQPIKQVLQGAA